MLSTDELKRYVCSEIEAQLGDISCNTLFFEEGQDNSAEGTYIFSKDNKYHVMFVEKGKIRSDDITTKERRILWYALEVVSNAVIMEFAIKNRKSGSDFRRLFFQKEVDIFSLFGQDFREEKEKQIENILKNNPYNDI